MKVVVKRAMALVLSSVALAAVCGSTAGAASGTTTSGSTSAQTHAEAERVGFRPTRLQIINDSHLPGFTPVTMELWAHPRGKTDNPSVRVATLGPGTSWEGTGSNDGFDNNIQVVINGTSRMRIVGSNPWSGDPYICGLVAPGKGGPYSRELGRSMTEHRSHELVVNDTNLWIHRNGDRDGNISLVAAIRKVPNQAYNPAEDGGWTPPPA